MKMPAPLPPAKMTPQNKETMPEWASANDKAVKQRIKETTMAKTGTPRESWYHQELKPTDTNEDTECKAALS